MGHLLNGKWVFDDVLKESEAGLYVKKPSQFRNWITADGSSGYPAEAGRYVLYSSIACPWAHRTAIFRVLKKLEDAIEMVDTEQSPEGAGWAFVDGPHLVPGTDTEVTHLHQVYALGDPQATTRVTVPVLWDSKTRTIVSNESSVIIRMFNSAFEGVAEPTPDYYPEPLRDEIDAMNDRVLKGINNAINGAGRSTSQDAYDQSIDLLFSTLDALEARAQAALHEVVQRRRVEFGIGRAQTDPGDVVDRLRIHRDDLWLVDASGVAGDLAELLINGGHRLVDVRARAEFEAHVPAPGLAHARHGHEAGDVAEPCLLFFDDVGLDLGGRRVLPHRRDRDDRRIDRRGHLHRDACGREQPGHDGEDHADGDGDGLADGEVDETVHGGCPLRRRCACELSRCASQRAIATWLLGTRRSLPSTMTVSPGSSSGADRASMSPQANSTVTGV